jgi:intracellular multiplication protein IcmQ
MLEFEIAVELTQRDISRVRQLLLTLVQRQPTKDTTKTYQEKAEELATILGAMGELLTRYHAIPLSDAPLQQPELQQEFFTMLENMLRLEKWQDRPLLQAAAQQLKKTYDQLLEQEGKKRPDAKETRAAALAERRATMIQVFISLYQSDGYNMKKWAALLEVISDLSASRPIFRQENDVRAVIRVKEQKQNEGYAVVYIYPTVVLPVTKGQTAQDKSGHDFVFVKERALRPENIIYFEHVSGRYLLQEGVLIRQGDSSFM